MPHLGQAMAKKYGKDYSIASRKAPYPLKYMVWMMAPYLGLGVDREFVSKNWGIDCCFDTTKSKEALGIEYISVEQSVQDMFQQLIDAKAVVPKKK